MIYVCSDIHGRYDKYLKVFDIVTPDDTLYILGDVIDRSPDGIIILQDIQKHNNIEFFCGNHEFMMYLAMFDSNKIVNEYYKGIWIYAANGGYSTYCALNSLSENEKLKIKNMILSSTVFRRITIKNTRYYLSHAGVNLRYNSYDYMRFKDVDKTVLESLLWDSCLAYNTPISNNETIIVGHRYVQHYHNSNKAYRLGNIIDIDGGLAIRDDSISNLILLRLDDNTEFYL